VISAKVKRIVYCVYNCCNNFVMLFEIIMFDFRWKSAVVGNEISSVLIASTRFFVVVACGV
jgi:hypothetical protein